jgi:thiol-disulfide isomerase/thioredoxin
MNLRSIAFAAFAAATFITAPATAQPVKPFSTAALKAARAAGQPVLVDAFAPWCPTCRAQAPTIEAIAASPAYAKLVIFRLDYDNQIAEKAALGIGKQSTLIAFKGNAEVGRSVGVTDPAAIKGLAAASLK